jgi:hypothetical protein
VIRPLLLLALLLGAFVSPVEAKPGDSLDGLLPKIPGLKRTGGLAARGAAPGYSFEIWEDHIGQEITFTDTFLAADPGSDRSLGYLPKTTLVVMKTPQGGRFVLSEARETAFEAPEEMEAWQAKHEKDAAKRVVKAKGFTEIIATLWKRTVLKTPILEPVFTDGRRTIFKGLLDEGKITKLLLIPDWGAIPEEYPPNTKVGGSLKEIEYLTEYEHLVVADLTTKIKRSHRKR